MSAYIVFMRLHTRDQSKLDSYARHVPETTAGRSVKFLARFGRHEVLEGAGVEGVAILEFPTIEEARAWYDSPTYRSAAQDRFVGGDYSAVIIEGSDAGK
jgi:uncharacterized protein (DUF1330 family)